MSMSVKIAVCDDSAHFNKELCEKISDFFSKEGIQTSLYAFTNAFELLEQTASVIFDILFLDIDMPALDGIKAAQRLRQQNDYTAVVFITNREDLVFEAIKFKPFRFIRKERLDAELGEALEAFVSDLKTASLIREFSTPNGAVSLNTAEIVYLEILDHDLYAYYRDKKLKVKGTLNQLEEELSPFGFIRIHSGFLVNFRFIFLINKTDIILDDGTSLPLSRRKYDSAKAQFQLFSRQKRT